MSRRVGGPVDYQLLAQLHRPRDLASLAAAARDLRAQGLQPRDIAEALAVSPLAVGHLLHHDEAQEGTHHDQEAQP